MIDKSIIRLIKSPVYATLVTYLFNHMFLSLWENAGLTGHVTSVDARIGFSMRAFFVAENSTANHMTKEGTDSNEFHEKGGHQNAAIRMRQVQKDHVCKGYHR